MHNQIEEVSSGGSMASSAAVEASDLLGHCWQRPLGRNEGVEPVADNCNTQPFPTGWQVPVLEVVLVCCRACQEHIAMLH